MKRLPLVISLEGIKRTKEEETKSVQEAVSENIKQIMLIWGRQQQKGMGEEDRRKFYKISDAFDEAVKQKKDEVELDDTWFGFIRKCKKEIGFEPNLLARRIEEIIDGVPDR